MGDWLFQNKASLAVGVILICLVVLVAVWMVLNRKKGKSSCGCACGDCPMKGDCQKKDPPHTASR